MLKFGPHGTYRVTRKGNIIEVIAIDEWNDVTANQLFSEVNMLRKEITTSTWATLIDVKDWVLGTPDMQQLTMNGTKIMHSKGMLKEAFVTGLNEGSLTMAQLHAMTPTLDGYERKFFKSHLEAIAWLLDEGYTLS